MAKKSYQQLKSALDEVLTQLESEDTDIDKSLELYKKGQKLATELEVYLASAKAKIDVLKTEQ